MVNTFTTKKKFLLVFSLVVIRRNGRRKEFYLLSELRIISPPPLKDSFRKRTTEMADNEEEGEQDGQQQKKKFDRPVRRLVIRESDQPSALQKEVIEFAQQALDENTWSKNIAQYVKKKLDEEKSGTWHVIHGSNFAGNVTADAKTLINFYLDTSAFLVFRSGPPEKSKPLEEKRE